MRIGFIGLGNMGRGIARNLLRAGNELTVFNRSKEKAQALAENGAKVANSPAEAARDAEAVFTMLADDPAVSEVVFGPQGLLSGLAAGATHISSSTISTGLARQLATRHAEHKQQMVSAPVFGRPDAAENKKLLVAVAGPAEIVDRLRPLFDAIGRQTFVIGTEPWQASAVKLCGNFMIASVMESLGETFAVMRKAGMDQHAFLNVMSSLFDSPIYKNYGGSIADARFEPAGFPLKLGLKDIRLALEAGQELNVPMPFASVLRDHFLAAMAEGQEKLDWSSVALVAQRNAGLD